MEVNQIPRKTKGYRNFGKRRYYAISPIYDTKSSAKKSAKRRRQQGDKIRVTKHKSKYVLWRRGELR